MTREIHVQRRVPATGIPAPAVLRQWARAAIASECAAAGTDEPSRERLGELPGELTIRIVDESESAALNERFRHKAYPTNVLSFPYDAEALDEPILGDLVICAPVVSREAAEQHKDARAHWAHLVVHGVLHLLGYDHENDADAEHMEARERAILATLGFPDPY